MAGIGNFSNYGYHQLGMQRTGGLKQTRLTEDVKQFTTWKSMNEACKAGQLKDGDVVEIKVGEDVQRVTIRKWDGGWGCVFN